MALWYNELALATYDDTNQKSLLSSFVQMFEELVNMLIMGVAELNMEIRQAKLASITETSFFHRLRL